MTGFEQDPVPAGKQFMISTRDNSDYKWQNMPDVVGCLEIPSVPDFQPNAPYIDRSVPEHAELFQDCLTKFDALQLRDDFAKACASVPKATCCCGLLPDDDKTMDDAKKALEAGWVKNTNRLLKKKQYTFQIDVFSWSWHNATGKAETNILLIRFMVPQLKKEVQRRKESIDE